MSSGLKSRRGAFVAAVTAVVVAGMIAAGVAISRSNNSNIAATTTPSPAVATATVPASPPATQSASASAEPGILPFADCSTAQFGPALQPQSPPSDVHSYAAAPSKQTDDSKLYQATITTAKGSIVLCLQPALAPNTVNNFVVLARNHFYDGLKFHRVEAGFVIQGGDPQGTGAGGPGYQFNDEPVKQSYVEGALAMANSGPNTNGSQFFIDTADDSSKLEPNYNLFGKVQSGLDVVHKIAVGDVMTTVTVAQQQ